jgi:hypothetical protein
MRVRIGGGGACYVAQHSRNAKDKPSYRNTHMRHTCKEASDLDCHAAKVRPILCSPRFVVRSRAPAAFLSCPAAASRVGAGKDPVPFLVTD